MKCSCDCDCPNVTDNFSGMCDDCLKGIHHDGVV